MTTTNIETITEEEYKRLLEIIQKPELGKSELQTGEVKNLLKPWMSDAVELGLDTGRRLGEVVQMKFNGIAVDDNGKPMYIKVEDFKVNRQKGNARENTKYIYVPITKSLQELLLRIGYEKYKGSDKYILAPEEKMERETISSFVSHSFTHYYKQLETGRDLSYKCLRKTYISSLSASLGIDNARLITKHSGTQVMEEHYVDKKVIALTAKNFEVFNQDEKRKLELDKVRNSNHEITLER